MLMRGSQAIGGADSCMRLPPGKVLGTSRSNSGQHCYRRIISRIHSALNAERSCEFAAPPWDGQVSTFRLGGSYSHGLAGREIFTNTRTIQAPDEEERAPPQRTGVLEKGGAAKALVLAKLPYVALMLCITTLFHVHAKPVMSTLIEFYIFTICFLETKMHAPRVWSTVCDEPRRVRFLNMSVIQHIRV